MTYCDKSILNPDCERPECKACGLHREPEKKDVWEEFDFKVDASVRPSKKTMSGWETVFDPEYLKEYVHVNFIPRAELVENVKKLKDVEDTEFKGWQIVEEKAGGKNCCPGDDVWLGYETALDDLLDLIKNND